MQVRHIARTEARVDEYEAAGRLDEHAQRRYAAEARSENRSKPGMHRSAIQIVNVHASLDFRVLRGELIGSMALVDP